MFVYHFHPYKYMNSLKENLTLTSKNNGENENLLKNNGTWVGVWVGGLAVWLGCPSCL